MTLDNHILPCVEGADLSEAEAVASEIEAFWRATIYQPIRVSTSSVVFEDEGGEMQERCQRDPLSGQRAWAKQIVPGWRSRSSRRRKFRVYHLVEDKEVDLKLNGDFGVWQRTYSGLELRFHRALGPILHPPSPEVTLKAFWVKRATYPTMRAKDRKHHFPQRLRRILADCYGEQCAFCERHTPYQDPEQGSVGGSLDHLIPRAWGGPDEPWNLWWACRRCNTSKGKRLHPKALWEALGRCHCALYLGRVHRGFGGEPFEQGPALY